MLKDSVSFFPFEQMYRLTPSNFLQVMVDYRERTLVKGIANIAEDITTNLMMAVEEEINNFRV